jgi:hypothetical protein
MHAGIQGPTRSFAIQLLAWYNHAVLRMKQRARELRKNLRVKRPLGRGRLYPFFSLAAIIAGATGCALWLDSKAAGVFALGLLFLMANINKSLERIAAGIRTQPAAALHEHAAHAEPKDARKIFISTKAMERLRPWVEDESSLTEESAKAYCSVLLDTLAMLHPRLTDTTYAEDKWS